MEVSSFNQRLRATVIQPPLFRPNCRDRDGAGKRLLLQYAALLEYSVTRWPDRPAYLNLQIS